VRICTAAILAATLCSASFANAETPSQEKQNESPLKVLLGAGITFGGDDLVRAEFDDGSSDKLYAGGFIDLKVGMIYELPESPYIFQSSIGYFFDSIDAENGDASFDRIPLEFLGFYSWDKHRIGLGATYHTGVELDISIDGVGSGKADFDNSLGTVIEYGYEVHDKFVLSLRGTMIDYSVEGAASSEDIDGNHVGLYANFTL